MTYMHRTIEELRALPAGSLRIDHGIDPTLPTVEELVNRHGSLDGEREGIAVADLAEADATFLLRHMTEVRRVLSQMIDRWRAGDGVAQILACAYPREDDPTVEHMANYLLRDDIAESLVSTVRRVQSGQI